MNIDTIFLIGPQGSGKGTQARILAEKYGFFYFEMGAILREIAKDPNELGQKIASLINQGQLVDDTTALQVSEDKLKQLPQNKGVLFDGIPRRLSQAHFLFGFLKDIGKKDFVTLFLNVPHEESVKRLLERAHHEFRKDDTEQTIRKRLEIYDNDTVPVLDFLRTMTTFLEIDGRPGIEDVTKEIDGALGI